MKFDDLPARVRVFGNQSFRGDCPPEEIDQINFFSWLRHNHPQYFEIALHPKNEGARNPQQVARDRALGSLNTGAVDVIMPAKRPFVCEIKRRDHTKSRWASRQKPYLVNASGLGAYACVALGFEGAKEAFLDYLNNEKQKGRA